MIGLLLAGPAAAADAAAGSGAEDFSRRGPGPHRSLAIDLARNRLFIAELGNNSLGVVDLAAGKLLRRIGGLDEPQGVAYDPATDTVYVVRRRWLVHRFKGTELTPLNSIQLGGDADNVRLDPEAGRVVVGYGDGALALIDAASGKPTTGDPPARPP